MSITEGMVANKTATTGPWPSGSMPALRFEAPGRLGIAEVPVPEPAPGQVLVRVRYVGVCGTDAHLLSGHYADVRNGVTKYPIRFGHEWAGEVLAVADGADPALLGRLVVGEPFLSCGHCRTCRSGHYNLCPHRNEMGVRGGVPGAAAEYLRVPAANIAAVPGGVPAHHAPLAEPSVTVLHAYELARAQPGEHVAVLGTGTMGLVAVQVGASMGCRVDAIGIDDAGLGTASESGAAAALRPEAAPSGEYDVVIDATGAASIGPMLTRIAGPAGRVMAVGIPGEPVDGVDLAGFVAKGLTLHGVLGGVHLLPRALSLIADKRIRPDLLVDSVVPVSQAVAAFQKTAEPGRARPKVLLDLSTLTGAVLADGGTTRG